VVACAFLVFRFRVKKLFFFFFVLLMCENDQIMFIVNESVFEKTMWLVFKDVLHVLNLRLCLLPNLNRVLLIYNVMIMNARF